MKHTHTKHGLALTLIGFGLAATGCLGQEPEGLAEAAPAEVTVKMDFFHKPLPEIPLPNDVATRSDATSATGLRINASQIAPTELEQRVRQLIDTLDGWGLYQPITIPFTGPLDVQSIVDAHHNDDYNLDNDVVYLVNVDPDSPKYGEFSHLDVGNGNHPVVLERLDYWKNDSRAHTNSLLFEETDEDVNGNGILDPGEDANRNGMLDPGEDLDGDGELDLPEDTDADGVLDKPNYYPGANPAPDDLAGRADALMTFYERETNTLIVRPMLPLDERTTYAVVVTRRLKDEQGRPVGSPFKFINHTSQTKALSPLKQILPDAMGLSLEDIAFAFTFTTQTVQSNWVSVYEGLYGHGVQKHLDKEYPAELASIEPLRDGDYPDFADADNLHIIHTETIIDTLGLLATSLLGSGGKELTMALEAQRYIDYHVMGSFNSPQLFARNDADGNPLPLNAQSWPQDLTHVAAPARSEQIYFWLMMPRKEISERGQNKPVPIVFLGHGYTSNRLEALLLGGFIARHGVAVMAIENVSHGLAINEEEAELAELLLGSVGLQPFLDAASKGRAFDQNNDGSPDSGADFWTSYLFHTRDVVRQSVLDYVQLIRVIQSFDGQKQWAFDLNNDGQPELAGDFDGDGIVDISADSPLMATGGSLGGFTSSIVGALEPRIDVITPISGGGGISDLGVRSVQGGVREAFILRVMAPLYVGTTNADTGEMLVETIVNNLNKDAIYPVARIMGVTPGDTLIAKNIASGERGCGFVSKDGTVRVGVASDRNALHVLEFYKGNALASGSTECEIVEGLTPFITVDTFELDCNPDAYRRSCSCMNAANEDCDGLDEQGCSCVVSHQGELYPKGTDLQALEEGLGLRRANPETRRFGPIAQLVLDPADPAVYARHLSKEPLVYPNLGLETWTNALIITTLGDMNVPAHGGVTIGRAAGYIDFLNPDPRYGKTPNQVLIDTYTAEAVHTLKRYTDPNGNGVHLDIENFSEGTDVWGDTIPRLSPPLRLYAYQKGSKGVEEGFSGAIFPFPIPTGQHGFPFPGNLIDVAIDQCKDECAEDQNCDCDNIETFDVGNYMFNLIGEYMRSGGRNIRPALCQQDDSCSYLPPAPERRTDIR